MPRTSMTGPCAVALATLILLPARASAQQPDPDRVAAVLALEVGQRVRLDLAERGRVEGRFAFGSDTSLTLVRDDLPLQFRVPDIERLWVHGRATGRGALVGAGVGALVGIVYGLLISEVACEPIDGGDCTTAEGAMLTGLLGGAGGAVLGAGVGYAIPVWRSRFP